ncbi:hypothetical protein M1512_04005 [Patescibacteria group bacterium]|jgi:hypothetical protein|nr:hypothetical protein [Patescibacteria group bacterium]
MERWFGGFKDELKPLTRLSDPTGTHETVALQIHYYNTMRIQNTLKTTLANCVNGLTKTKG